MLLYHGTSEHAALEALKSGLRPRRATGVSNWEHTSPSNPDMVYLTSTYACHFAIHAKMHGVRLVGQDGKLSNRAAVIEIDTRLLPFHKFMADEDFLAFREVYSGAGAGNVNTAVAEHRTLLTHEWKASLEFMGNCCFAGTIPARRFTRIAFFDPKKIRDMAMAMADGSVTPISFKYAGFRHRAYTRWLFGETITAQELLGLNGLTEEHMGVEKARLDYWETNILSNREGIEILDFREKNNAKNNHRHCA